MNVVEKAIQKDSWKELKLAVLYIEYGKVAKEWNNLFPPVKDDRRIFINIYNQLVTAIKSLPDNPHNVVCVAMNRYITGEKEMLDEIKERFIK